VKTPQDRLQFVEGMRGFAALFVVLSHFRSMVAPGSLNSKANAHLQPWFKALLAPFDHSHLAVAAFIVLSGFCLQVSLFNRRDGRISDLKRFFVRRAWRILPPYYACLGLSIFVAVFLTSKQHGMPFDQYVPVTWGNVLSHVFLVHNFSPDSMYKINGVLWSIALEVQLYVAFPLLVAALFRFGRVGLLALTSGLALACLALFPTAAKLYPWFMPLFALGMVAAHFSYRPNLRVSVVPRLALFVSLFGAGLLIWSLQTRQMIAVGDVAVGLFVAGLIYVGSVAPGNVLTRFFASRWPVAVGGFSYSLYLMHHPILQGLYVYRPAFTHGPFAAYAYLLVIGLPVILGACYLFSRAFEQPFILSRKSQEPVLRDAIGAPVALPLKASDSIVGGYLPPRRRFRTAVVTMAAQESWAHKPVL